MSTPELVKSYTERQGLKPFTVHYRDGGAEVILARDSGSALKLAELESPDVLMVCPGVPEANEQRPLTAAEVLVCALAVLAYVAVLYVIAALWQAGYR